MHWVFLLLILIVGWCPIGRSITRIYNEIDESIPNKSKKHSLYRTERRDCGNCQYKQVDP